MIFAAATIAITAAIIIGAIWVFVRHLPTAERFRGIFLRDSTSREAGYISGKTRDDLVGLEGEAITDLRPAGTVRINQDGMSYGYRSFLKRRGADEGDILVAEFDLAEGTARLLLADDELLERWDPIG